MLKVGVNYKIITQPIVLKVRWVNNIYMKKIIAFGVAFAPFLASAQAVVQNASNVNNLITFLSGLLRAAVVLLLAAAVVFFLWNVFKYVMSAGDGEAKAEANKGIIYGIVGIFIMSSVYGLVNFIGGSLNLTPGTVAPPVLPVNF